MNLSHEFKKEDKEYFRYEYACMECGRSDRGLELHHIKGRRNFEKFLSSIFNAILLCKYCHDKILHTKEEEEKFVLKTMKFLKEENYKPNKNDLEYLKKYNLIHLIKEI